MANLMKKTKSYTFIDLFAGAGGLSEGFIRAGYTPIAAYRDEQGRLQHAENTIGISLSSEKWNAFDL